MTEKDVYLFCLENNVNLEYGKLTLCDLRNYSHNMLVKHRRYQVHCEDRKFEFSQIYDQKEDAVDKFLQIKNTIRKFVR